MQNLQEEQNNLFEKYRETIEASLTYSDVPKDKAVHYPLFQEEKEELILNQGGNRIVGFRAKIETNDMITLPGKMKNIKVVRFGATKFDCEFPKELPDGDKLYPVPLEEVFHSDRPLYLMRAQIFERQSRQPVLHYCLLLVDPKKGTERFAGFEQLPKQDNQLLTLRNGQMEVARNDNYFKDFGGKFDRPIKVWVHLYYEGDFFFRKEFSIATEDFRNVKQIGLTKVEDNLNITQQIRILLNTNNNEEIQIEVPDAINVLDNVETSAMEIQDDDKEVKKNSDNQIPDSTVSTQASTQPNTQANDQTQ